MPNHKYQTGQEVQYWPKRLEAAAFGERFLIVRRLPVERGYPQYHIKSTTGHIQRVVREDQITPLPDAG